MMNRMEQAIEAALQKQFDARLRGPDGGVLIFWNELPTIAREITAALPLVGVEREDVAREQIVEAWYSARRALTLVKRSDGYSEVYPAGPNWPVVEDGAPLLIEGTWDAVDEWVDLRCADAVLALPRHTGQPQEGITEGAVEACAARLFGGLSAGSPVPSQQAAQVAFDRARVLRRAADSMDAQERRDRRDDEDLSRMADDMRRRADLADEIGKAIISASPRLPVAEREWQPIETAPKNGTVAVDLWIKSTSNATMRFPDAYWAGGWYSQTIGKRLGEQPFKNYSATHWRSLPAPPPLAEQGEKS